MIDGISILIVCYGRVKLLERLFCSLDEARKNCPLPSELVVLDNSGKEDASAIEILCEKHNARYYYEPSSVAIKRNKCVSYAKYNLLFYCDSDCVVTPNILNEHLKKYTDEKIGAVCGPVILEGGENSFIKAISKTSWCAAFVQPLEQEELSWGVTANFSLLREAFDKSGGFNPDFPNKPGGEDVDIGFRICDAGYVIKSAPDAVVYHSNETWLNFKDVATRLISYGRSNVLVAKSNPKRLIADVNWIAVWIMITALSLLCTCFVGCWALLMSPIMFLSHLLIGGVYSSVKEKIGFFKAILIELLSVFEKLGTISGCIKYKTVKPLYRQVMYSKYQEHGTFPGNQIKYLILLLSVSISFAVLLILV